MVNLVARDGCVQERTRKQAFGSAYSSQIQSFQISGCQTPLDDRRANLKSI